MYYAVNYNCKILETCSIGGEWLIIIQQLYDRTYPFKIMFLRNILMVRRMLVRIKVGCKPIYLHI